MQIGVVYHCEQTTHRLDAALTEIGAEVGRYRVDLDGSVPSDIRFDAVIVLGGAMGAYESHRYPWLDDEKAWLRKLVDQQTPVLGICLGSQLLADALGGRAFLSPKPPEAGLVDLHRTVAGSEDPVLRYAGRQVFSLHQDTFDLPPDAVLLASSTMYPQVFRIGSALGIQFHPDAEATLAVEWAEEIAPFLTRAGVDQADYESELESAEPVLDRESRAIFRAFLETV